MFKVSEKLSHHFNGFSSSASVILMFIYMKFRFSLSYRKLEEMMLMRGASVDHSTLQIWVKRFASLIDKRVRKRKKPVGSSWRMDETYIKLSGKWVYLYRAVDKEGYTVDFLLRAKRDKVAAKAFFKRAIKN
ncbi:MAG: IS6 family transposase, partial [Pseudomonadota bacterium]